MNRIYILTPIDHTEGLDPIPGWIMTFASAGYSSASGRAVTLLVKKVEALTKIIESYCPLPEGTRVLQPGEVAVSEDTLSYESLQPIVERIAYEQMSGDQLGDIVKKMDLLKQFIQTKLAQQGKEV